jgi:hypothetical protein
MADSFLLAASGVCQLMSEFIDESISSRKFYGVIFRGTHEQ